MLRAWTPLLSFCPRAAALVENDLWALAEEAAVAGFGPKGTWSPLRRFQGLCGAVTHGVVAVLIGGGWAYAIFSVTICRRV